MSLAEVKATQSDEAQYWIKLSNKLYNAAYKYCYHQCKMRNNIGEMPACGQYCYQSYLVKKKVVMHQAQDADDYNFRKCLAESSGDLDLETIFACTQTMHTDKMLLAA